MMRVDAKPTVSVIVPSYNHAPFLRERIESILGQTFEDYELILLDDASNDESRDIIHEFKRKYSHIQVFLNNLNSGSPFRQWDFGVRQARGEFVWIAESDDFAEHNFLAEMVPFLKRDDRVGLAYCDAQLVDERNRPGLTFSDSRVSYEGDRWKKDFVNRGINEIEEFLSRFNTINNTSGVLFRKTAYVNAGMADHGLAYCGDWFLYLNILRSHDLAYRAAPLNFIRIHPGSTCHRYYRNNTYLEEVILILRHLADSFKSNPQIKDNIEYRLSLELFAALRYGFLPSRHVFRCIRKLDPFFVLHVVKYAFRNGGQSFIQQVLKKKYPVNIVPQQPGFPQYPIDTIASDQQCPPLSL